MIEVSHLSRYYGDHRAVDEVSFTIASNTIVGFLGLNGAGKTTTLRVIAGLLPPSAGTVRIDGEDLATAPESFRKSIGFLPETPPLYVEQTVREFLRFVGRLRGMSAQEVENRLPDVIARCQLSGREDWVIDQLSHGYRKRVGIAMAIIHRPKLVILDEPISGLDPVQIVEMRKVIRSLGTECTVLVSSHILSEIGQTCDRILVLQKGKLVFQGTAAELGGHAAGSTRVHLTVSATEDTVRAIVARHPGATLGTLTTLESGVVDLTVDLSTDNRESLVAALVQGGVGLRSLVESKDELENVFVQLTKGVAADAARSAQ